MSKAVILVVEDEALIARDVQNTLRDLGYDVPAIAASGPVAIARADELRPDLILMDIRLQGEMDGIEAAREIRARLDIPVIFVTAYADANTLQRAKLSEPYGYVLKPFDERELAINIDMALYKHRMERDLKRAYERFGTVMDSLDQAVYVVDMDTYQVLFVNKYVQDLWGDVVGKTCWQVLQRGQTMPCAFCTNDKLVDADGHPAGLYVWEFQNTITGRWYEIRDRAISWVDGRLVRLEVATDITERKRAREALIRALRMETAATLAGGIAHKVNNMMVGVLGYSEMLKMELDEQPEMMDMLDVISTSAQQTSELATQMLAFARGSRPEPKVIDLNGIVQQVVQIEERTLSTGIRVEIEADPDLWAVKADPIQMSQVVLNLLRNAAEAIEGSGRIKVATHNMMADGAFSLAHPDLDPGPLVCLSVRDTGCGISAENLGRIYEPFFTTKFQGRGMGLSVVYGIVQDHGGDITVHSEEGRGATFTVYLAAVEP